MIAQLRGALVTAENGFAVLDVAGVGYKIYISAETQSTLTKQKKKEVCVFTHLAPRENALDLYGFLRTEDLSFFELLIGISGIGPKSALAILGVADVETLQTAIRAGESSYLTKVSGIGKKNAEKIILELKDKVGTLASGQEHEMVREEIDTVEALKALGYGQTEVREALKQIPKDLQDTGERLKAALKILGR